MKTLKNERINIRVSKKTKVKSAKIFKELGLTTSQAIEIYLKAVIKKNGIPFKLRLPNEETLEAINELENDKSLKVYDSVDEMFKEILNEKD